MAAHDFIKRLLVTMGVVGTLASCEHIDDKRIPYADVRIVFNTPGEWTLYGTPGAMDHRRFIKSERTPANYPFTELTYTGFGGVLLVCDYMGNPLAYDLACPVEVRYNVRVAVNPETLLAECPECHSTYYVFENYGAPVSGPAAQYHYGLQLYHVIPGYNGTFYTVLR